MIQIYDTLRLDHLVEVCVGDLFEFAAAFHDHLDGLNEREWNIVPGLGLALFEENVDGNHHCIGTFHHAWRKLRNRRVSIVRRNGVRIGRYRATFLQALYGGDHGS